MVNIIDSLHRPRKCTTHSCIVYIYKGQIRLKILYSYHIQIQLPNPHFTFVDRAQQNLCGFIFHFLQTSPCLSLLCFLLLWKMFERTPLFTLNIYKWEHLWLFHGVETPSFCLSSISNKVIFNLAVFSRDRYFGCFSERQKVKSHFKSSTNRYLSSIYAIIILFPNLTFISFPLSVSFYIEQSWKFYWVNIIKWKD